MTSPTGTDGSRRAPSPVGLPPSGHALVDLADDEIAALEACHPAPGTAEADGLLRCLEPVLARLLPHHAVRACTVLDGRDPAPLRRAGDRSGDLVVLRIPLATAGRTTGGLRLVEGSHRWPAGADPADVEGRATSVPLARGSACVLHGALLHGASGGARHATVEVVLAAPHHRPTTTAHAPDPAPAAPAPAVGGPVRRALRRALGRSLPFGGAAPLLAPTPHRALVEPAADEQLRRDGFVRLPLLAPATAAALRHAYGRLHGWEGSGFQADLTSTDLAYRRAVRDLLREELRPVLGALFADHVPFVANFVTKYPGDGSDLNLHQDWMYVDERSGRRTYVAWIALDDTDHRNGPIQVLRHSHRLDLALRGSNLNAAWLQDEAAIEPHLLTVPARAGEVIVMDNGLVHRSPPNRSDRVRVAVAVAVRPTAAPLVHFHRRGSGAADRYEVDDEFFVTRTPQELWATPPSDRPVEQVPAAEPPADAEVSLRRLATTPLAHLDRLRRRRTARSAVR